MTRDDLISAGYLDEQKTLHAAPRGYGGRGSKWAPTVVDLILKYNATSMLDYGCGQGTLVGTLKTLRTHSADALSMCEFYEYDPAIPGKDTPPDRAFDLVVCTDVLEHIESDHINAVMSHLASVTGRVIFVVIALEPTSKTLSDGRQAHILLKSIDWWKYMFDYHGFKYARDITGRDPKKDHKQFAAVFLR